jgi:ABC-type uncharacterized transport system substrate-binding protein
LLKEIAPRTVRIGAIYDPANVMQRQLPELERSLSPGVQLVALSVSSRSDLENAIERIATQWRSYRFCRPACCRPSRSNHITYGPDLIDQCRLAAGYIDRILKGEKPADLPVQFPTKYMLVINLNSAKALDPDLPASVLARADDVIE